MSNKIHTPMEAVREYLDAWVNVDVFGFFAVLQMTVRFRVLANQFLSFFLCLPENYEVLRDEDAEGIDGTIIRDVLIKINFGDGMRAARLRCVCEKMDGEGENAKIVLASTVDGGKWGVNPFSLRYS